MGFRMNIECGDDCCEFGKFYGYINAVYLESIEWLIKNKREYMGDISQEPIYEIPFTAEEFREFIDLYEQDINQYDFTNCSISYNKPYHLSNVWDKFDEIYHNSLPKTIYWG